ncbi:MAG: anti-sigma factor antagonist [Clostridiales bacterium]|jgi:stage II sporulation protein AA (anti-sigma F factor antagonist)|nr:anti-sigma factor antagonist [Clostridiales bacterium]
MIDHKLVGSTLYIGIRGELDENSAKGIRQRLDELTEAPGMEKAVFELSELTFMDSTGIGVLLGRYNKLKARGVPIFIANPRGNIDRVLTLSGIYGIMPKIEYSHGKR